MYREVTMIEVTEVLRLWRAGLPTKRLAAQLCQTSVVFSNVQPSLGAPSCADHSEQCVQDRIKFLGQVLGQEAKHEVAVPLKQAVLVSW